jgi:pyruvate/2-oxoglutarate dehydrogenase complex dihydrolipoamide dehydrogenase (E3) component
MYTQCVHTALHIISLHTLDQHFVVYMYCTLRLCVQAFPLITVVTEATPDTTTTTSTATDTATAATATATVSYECEALLIAAGRKPNVTGIGLETAGIRYSVTDGVTVTDTLQTTNRAVYAVGDCCTKYQFTHVSDFMARLVIRNALFFGNGKFRSVGHTVCNCHF